MSGPIPFDVFKHAIIDQESGGRYGVPNAQGSGAMGVGQIMPETARSLAAKQGLPYRPDLLRGTDPDAQHYQDVLTDAAAREAYHFGGDGADPRKAAHYYYGGSNTDGWGPKTRAYGNAILAKIGGATMADRGNPLNGAELPPAGPDLHPQSPLAMATSPVARQAVPSGLDAAFDTQRRSVSDMYDQAAQQLQASYRGPGTSEMLLALGAGLLQPTRSGSFGEALGNGLQGVMPIISARNQFHNTSAHELATLRLAKAKGLSDLQAKYMLARLKGPPARHFIADAQGHRFDTSTAFDAPTPGRIAFLLQHPEADAMFDGQYGPGAAADVRAKYGPGAGDAASVSALLGGAAPDVGEE